jgi:hypothetical protein
MPGTDLGFHYKDTKYVMFLSNSWRSLSSNRQCKTHLQAKVSAFTAVKMSGISVLVEIQAFAV